MEQNVCHFCLRYDKCVEDVETCHANCSPKYMVVVFGMPQWPTLTNIVQIIQATMVNEL